MLQIILLLIFVLGLVPLETTSFPVEICFWVCVLLASYLIAEAYLVPKDVTKNSRIQEKNINPLRNKILFRNNILSLLETESILSNDERSKVYLVLEAIQKNSNINLLDADFVHRLVLRSQEKEQGAGKQPELAPILKNKHQLI